MQHKHDNQVGVINLMKLCKVLCSIYKISKNKLSKKQMMRFYINISMVPVFKVLEIIVF